MPTYKACVYRTTVEYQSIKVEADDMQEAIGEFEKLKKENWEQKGEVVKVDTPTVTRIVRVEW